MKKLAFLVFAIVALAGCNSGNVSLSDIQKNAKENADAASKNPGTGANSY